ncbi:hypothetical protein ACFL17_03710 [Pseudomonadota bacterium]
MDNTYYDTIENLENLNTDREYIDGWIGGFLGNPLREEQRITDAYTAGYADGRKKITENAGTWQK